MMSRFISHFGTFWEVRLLKLRTSVYVVTTRLLVSGSRRSDQSRFTNPPDQSLHRLLDREYSRERVRETDVALQWTCRYSVCVCLLGFPKRTEIRDIQFKLFVVKTINVVFFLFWGFGFLDDTGNCFRNSTKNGMSCREKCKDEHSTKPSLLIKGVSTV